TAARTASTGSVGPGGRQPAGSGSGAGAGLIAATLAVPLAAAGEYRACPDDEEDRVGIVLRILINAAALWAAVQLVPGFSFDFDGDAWVGFLVLALLLGAVNAVVKPILKLLSLPAIVLTLGLFLVLVNAVVLAIVVWLAEALGLPLASEDFVATLLAALVVSVVSWALETFLGQD
ncbi:MAG: phage holin family protein, partial [Nitriliruptoraceae bacterium]